MEQSPRPLWKLFVIEDTIMGNDELVRAAKVLVTTRLVGKLIPLEL